jgi:hypothetical protein
LPQNGLAKTGTAAAVNRGSSGRLSLSVSAGRPSISEFFCPKTLAVRY